MIDQTILPYEFKTVDIKTAEEMYFAIKDMIVELEKKPISIKTLNVRVDTARDLVLKLFNTSNEIVKTAAMSEIAIVYGNRYRPVNKNLDNSITKSEEFFFKGEYKNALETTLRALENIEPGIHEKLLLSVKK